MDCELPPLYQPPVRSILQSVAEVREDDKRSHFFAAVLDQARDYELLSDEHFTVDGTLLEAAASLKSFKPKDETNEPPPDDPGNPTVNFHGQKRSNETHQSSTDPDSMLCRKGKGKEAKLGYAGHLLMENRMAWRFLPA